MVQLQHQGNGATGTQISSIADSVNDWGNRCPAFCTNLPQQIGGHADGHDPLCGVSQLRWTTRRRTWS
jgi:hypothetical protein